jgi:ribosomal protein L17
MLDKKIIEEAKANTSLQRAKEFVKEMEKLLISLNK